MRLNKAHWFVVCSLLFAGAAEAQRLSRPPATLASIGAAAASALNGPLTVTSGNVTLKNGYSLAFADTSGGTTTYVYSAGSGVVSMVSTSGAIELDLTSVMATGKVYLDSSRTMWVSEQSGKVVIGTGSTNLFSITSAGVVTAKGAINGSGAP